MENKKKYHGVLKVLLLLLFGILFATSSTCYASISDEYLTYSLNQLKTFNGSYSSVFNHCIDVSIANKTSIINKLNELEKRYNLTNLNDINYSFFVENVERNTSSFIIYISNNGAGTNNLNFIELYDNYITPHENDNSKLYALSIKVDKSSDYIGYYTPYTLNYGSLLSYVRTSYSINSEKDVLTMSTIACAGLPAIYWRNNFTSNGTVYPVILLDNNGNYKIEKPEPEEPSGDISNGGTGTITNPSGDTTGKIDLSGIEQGIGNIQNQISGDTQKVIENQNQNTQTIVNAISGETEKITNTLTDNADDLIDNTIITSGDIESALNFEIAEDPYSNFWFTLTNNLKSALLGSKRSIDISFQGRTWTISLDEYMVLPAWLVIILTPFSTAFFTWVLVRQFKLIFNKLASGNVDSLLKENSEERYF